MNHAARRAIDDSTESLFLAACTSTPVTDDALFVVRNLTILLEKAIASDDVGELRVMLEKCDLRQSRSADLFACAVQSLADSLPPGVARLRAFVHRVAKLERRIFDDTPVSGESSSPFPFVYVS
jgi:hypothetical protein